MLHNARVTAFTVSELLRENQQGEGLKLPPPHRPRLGLKRERLKVYGSLNKTVIAL